MSIRTLDDLESLLDESISWRRIELQALKSALVVAAQRSPTAPLARALSRSSIAMLYAHWEGFVKEACQGYVGYVAIRRLKCKELNDDLLRTVLLGLQRRLTSGDDQAAIDFIDLVRRPDEVRARLPKETMVDTKSNLRYSVLADIFSSIGFSTERFETKGNLIDKSLCEARNSIAHGRPHYPNPLDFPALQNEVIEMMEDVRDLILASVRTQSYRNQ
jgi:hypothetical protein